MSNNYLIHEYLDTGLDSAREQTLFAALASDPLLRQEFSRQLQMKNIVEEEARKVTPPAALAGNIFGQLGYALPAGIASTTAAVPFFHKLFPILGSLASIAFLAFLAVSTTGDTELSNGSPDYIFVNNASSKASTQNVLSQNSAQPTSQEQMASYSDLNNREENSSLDNLAAIYADSLALLKSQFAELQGELSIRDRKLKNMQVSLNDMAYNSRNASNRETYSNSNSESQNSSNNNTQQFQFNLSFEDILGDNESSIINNKIEFLPMLAESVKKRLAEVISSKQYQDAIKDNTKPSEADTKEPNFSDNAIYNSNALSFPESEFLDMYVTVQYLSSVSSPDIGLDAEMPSLQSNVGMHLNGYFSVVANFGVESYGQSFNTIQNGREIIRNQNPSVYFVTGGLRANTPYIFTLLRPYAQLTGGYSSFGPMARATAGIEYRTNDLLSIVLSGEYSYLGYSVGTNNYTTNNSGVSLGIVIHP